MLGEELPILTPELVVGFRKNHKRFKRMHDKAGQIKASMGLYGVFGARFFDARTQKTIFKCEKRNQITNEGREAVLELLFHDPAGTEQQQNPEYNQLWSLSLGAGTLPPTVADTGLISPVYTSAINITGGELTKVTLPPTTYELVLNKTIPSGTLASGVSVSEAGLFTRGDSDGPGTGQSRNADHATLADCGFLL